MSIEPYYEFVTNSMLLATVKYFHSLKERMMYKFLSILLFCFVAVLVAQDQVSYKNALGWESGLSYRRYLNNSVWVGINLSGSYDNTLSNDTQFNLATFVANDSTSSYRSNTKDTNRVYSGTVKIELGKEIFKYKKLDIDAFIASGFILTDSKFFNGFNGTDLNETKGYSILGIIAFEPKILLWDRISIGTQVGFQYTYTNSKYNYNDQYSSASSTSISTDNKSTFENNFKLLGTISISSSLVVHYYF